MEQILAFKARIEAHIGSLDYANRKPINLYQPIAYILSLKGKRIRPILTLMAYEAISGYEIAKVLNLAIAVELFHNFTLMHDDIMDRAPVRRGMPTVHIKWNEDIAILSGDALFACAMELVIKDFPKHAAALGTEFAQVALKVCEGQMEDMDFAERNDVSIDEYIEMIRKKTAVLLGGCLSLGAIAAGADRKLVGQMRELGECVGIGFQLQDDLMDAFPPEGFGKQVGGDIIENKKTYLLLKAFELASKRQKERLQHFIDIEKDEGKKVEGVLKIFRELDIEGKTHEIIQLYFEKARILSTELAKEVNFAPIRQYLEEIVNRKL